MRLAPYPKLGRYKGKGRPDAALFPRGVPTLPPLDSLTAPLATINPNGDPKGDIIARARAQMTQLTNDLLVVTPAADRRRLTATMELFGRMITATENCP